MANESQTTIHDLLLGGWYRVYAAKEWCHQRAPGFHTFPDAVRLYLAGVKYG